MSFNATLICPTKEYCNIGKMSKISHGQVAGNSKSLMDKWWEKITKLGTIIGPGEDKNRNMTSMSETRIKLSYNVKSRLPKK